MAIVAAGIGLALVMQAGGGKSPTVVMHYIEHLKSARSGMDGMCEIKKGVRNSSKIR